MEQPRGKQKLGPPTPMTSLSAADLAKHQKQFVGLEKLKADLREKDGEGFGCLRKFELWAKDGQWQNFSPDVSHYDWWCFPVSDVRYLTYLSSKFSFQYTVLSAQAAMLIADAAFLRDYRRCYELVCASWGWDLANAAPVASPTTYQSWNFADVRLGKMGESAHLFQQEDVFRSLVVLAMHLRKEGHKLEKRVKDIYGVRL